MREEATPVYEPTIGLETHAQLLTRSKMFCSCRVPPVGNQDTVPTSTASGSTAGTAVPPNSLVCPVCLGMPGSLPVINRRAVEHVIMTGLALNCRIAETSRFARKNYSYPDLPKGYQISQWDLPLCYDGWIEIRIDGHTKRIGIHDVHLEEDTGKLIHVGDHSLVDFNRSGVPLMEIVTDPDFTSLEEVHRYVLELRRILRYLGVSSGDMEAGAMRFEGNISLHVAGTAEKGERVEVKNLNSFKALLRALQYEMDRQDTVLCSGGVVQRETRGWDEAHGVTFVQRGKESADDYRYFPEPDLPPLMIAQEWVTRVRAALPELPDERRRRFMSECGLGAYDADLLTEERAVADYFEHAASAARPKGLATKAVANWITGELFHLLDSTSTEITAIKVTPERLAQLAALVKNGAINMTTGKHVLEVMFKTGRPADQIVAEKDLARIADADQLSFVVEEVIASNAEAAAHYRGGKETALRFLVGQVMKATGGRADPVLTTRLLKTKLTSG